MTDPGPASVSSPSNPSGLVAERLPSIFASVEDVLVGLEYPVGEIGLAQELPDILDRVELRRARRQRQEGDVVWYDELAREVPAGLGSVPIKRFSS